MLNDLSRIARAAALGTGNCSVPGPDRADCGWPGIQEEVCLGRGCCWNNTVHGYAWCFGEKALRARTPRSIALNLFQFVSLDGFQWTSGAWTPPRTFCVVHWLSERVSLGQDFQRTERSIGSRQSLALRIRFPSPCPLEILVKWYPLNFGCLKTIFTRDLHCVWPSQF